MTGFAAVWDGLGERETFDLLVRLARQAVRRSGPPPFPGHATWDGDAFADLVGEVCVRRPALVESALLETTSEAGFELYLLSGIQNVLRDMGRETERGKLIERLRTILGFEVLFVRHEQPYAAWRLAAAPAVEWQGDIGDLIAAALRLRGVTATRWNQSGPTPRETRVAIVRVSEAALTEANGFVRDPDLAVVVQTCVPAAPIDAGDREVLEDAQDPSATIIGAAESGFVGVDLAVEAPTPEQVAEAVWFNLDEEERAAVPHLESARGVAMALGVSRRMGAAITDSARAKIRHATTAELEAPVVDCLCERARGLTEHSAVGDRAGSTEDGPSTDTPRGRS